MKTTWTLAFLVGVLTLAGLAVLVRVVRLGCTPSTPLLVFVGVAFVLAVGLAVPMQFKELLSTISSAHIPKIGDER